MVLTRHSEGELSEKNEKRSTRKKTMLNVINAMRYRVSRHTHTRCFCVLYSFWYGCAIDIDNSNEYALRQRAKTITNSHDDRNSHQNGAKCL